MSFAKDFMFPAKIAREYVPVKQLSGSTWLARKNDCENGTVSTTVIKKCTNPFESSARAKYQLRELHLLRTIRHDNIARLIGTYSAVEEDGREAIYHITEYAGESMSERIDRGDYSMELVKKWTREMLFAVQHLHSNGMIHGNLHPRSICINGDNKILLIDFGRIPTRQSVHSEGDINKYSALELIVEMSGGCDEKVDIWSITAILFQLITGTALFDEGNDLIRQQIQYLRPIDAMIKSDEKAHFRKCLEAAPNNANSRTAFIALMRDRLERQPPRGISEEDVADETNNLRNFIDKTLQFDPARRMTTARALSHPFLCPQPPWVRGVPEEDSLALPILERRIRKELQISSVPE